MKFDKFVEECRKWADGHEPSRGCVSGSSVTSTIEDVGDEVLHYRGVCHARYANWPWAKSRYWDEEEYRNASHKHIAALLPKYNEEGDGDLTEEIAETYFDALLSFDLYKPLLEDSVRFTPEKLDEDKPQDWLCFKITGKTCWIYAHFLTATRVPFEDPDTVVSWYHLVKDGLDPFRAFITSQLVSASSCGKFSYRNIYTHGTCWDGIPSNLYAKIQTAYSEEPKNVSVGFSRGSFRITNVFCASYAYDKYGPIHDLCTKVVRGIRDKATYVPEVLKKVPESRFGAVKKVQEVDAAKGNARNELSSLTTEEALAMCNEVFEQLTDYKVYHKEVPVHERAA